MRSDFQKKTMDDEDFFSYVPNYLHICTHSTCTCIQFIQSKDDISLAMGCWNSRRWQTTIIAGVKDDNDNGMVEDETAKHLKIKMMTAKKKEIAKYFHFCCWWWKALGERLKSLKMYFCWSLFLLPFIVHFNMCIYFIVDCNQISLMIRHHHKKVKETKLPPDHYHHTTHHYHHLF